MKNSMTVTDGVAFAEEAVRRSLRCIADKFLLGDRCWEGWTVQWEDVGERRRKFRIETNNPWWGISKFYRGLDFVAEGTVFRDLKTRIWRRAVLKFIWHTGGSKEFPFIVLAKAYFRVQLMDRGILDHLAVHPIRCEVSDHPSEGYREISLSPL